MSKIETALTIDVGLTNCKVSVFDYQGQMLYDVSRPYRTYKPQPNWSEQEIGDWWLAIKHCIAALRSTPLFAKIEVTVISVTAHMHGLIAIDQGRSPLTNCWTLFDRRAEAEAINLNNQLGTKTAYQITGGRLEAYTPAAKINWIMRNAPELGRKTYKFLAPKDVIRMHLCGDIASDPIDAAGSLLYDLRNKTWSDQISSAVGIHASQLPDVRHGTEIAGTLSHDAARELNLKAGIPIVVGAGDDVEALGAGIVRDGQVLEHIGTTGTLICCTNHYLEDEEQRIELYPHVIPDQYLIGGATNAAGRSLNWIKQLLFDNREDIEHVPLDYPGPKEQNALPIFFPYISGERGMLWDNRATGLLIGLRESHENKDVARAVYEGVAFSLREILEGVKSLGVNVTEIVSGGGNDFNPWSSLRADMYGMPLYFPKQRNVTGLGAALLGLVGIQIYGSLENAVHQCTSRGNVVLPDMEMIIYYNHRWERYKSLLPSISRFF